MDGVCGCQGGDSYSRSRGWQSDALLPREAGLHYEFEYCDDDLIEGEVWKDVGDDLLREVGE